MDRVTVTAEAVISLVSAIFRALGCGDGGPMREAAEEVLAGLRACPPAPGFKRVEVPGERERDYREKSAGKIAVPTPTWEQIRALAEELGADS